MEENKEGRMKGKDGGWKGKEERQKLLQLCLTEFLANPQKVWKIDNTKSCKKKKIKAILRMTQSCDFLNQVIFIALKRLNQTDITLRTLKKET